MNQPLLSVITLAYNHEPYIAKAIEGVLAQKVNFSFEYIIAEDHSTDNTYSICKKFADKNPIIKLVRAEKNLGMVLNDQRAFKLARGKYIAYCEGDDYWIDDEKLQKQADFLENHNDYGFVGSHIVIDDDGVFTREPSMIPVIKESNGFQLCGDVFSDAKWGPVGRMCSLMFRKKIVDSYIDDIIGDIVLETVLAKYSFYACYNSYASVYRTGVGVSAVKHDYDKALRYNEYVVMSRLKQKELFPVDCPWDEDELDDSTTYIKLKHSIELFRYLDAMRLKKQLKTSLYKNKNYAKRMKGFFSFVILFFMIKLKG